MNFDYTPLVQAVRTRTRRSVIEEARKIVDASYNFWNNVVPIDEHSKILIDVGSLISQRGIDITELSKKESVMKTFVITAGHSNTDPGAVAFGRKEADIAVDMRNMVAHYLIAAGHTVITDGDARDNKSLNEAVKLIPKGVVAIEFHCNAATPAAKGVELLAATKHKAISKQIASAIAGVLETSIRGEDGWKPENSGQHSRLAYVQGGGIICETFFITNATELAAWDAKKWLCAKAVAQALMDYYV